MLERKRDEHGEVKILCIEDLVAKKHLVRKIEKAVHFEEIYPMVEEYYSKDEGRPAVDPVVLVKMCYTHMRGLNRVQCWVGLKFAAMNLKKMAVWLDRVPFFPPFYALFSRFCALKALPA